MLAALVFGVVACGDNDNGTSTTCLPAEDSTGTLYEVLQDSVLVYSPESSDSGLVTVPLSGTFRLLRLPEDPHILINYQISALRLCGGSQFILEGIDGRAVLSIFDTPGQISGGFDASVNGDERMLFSGGRGSFHVDDNSAVFLDGLEFCAPPLPSARCATFQNGTETGFFLKIFAAPKGRGRIVDESSSANTRGAAKMRHYPMAANAAPSNPPTHLGG